MPNSAQNQNSAGSSPGLKTELIEAYINYRYSFSLTGFDPAFTNEQKLAKITANLQKHYDCIRPDSPEAAAEPVLQEIKITQDFLHGGGLPFFCQRFLLRSLKPELAKFALEPIGMHLAVFPEFNVGQLCFCFAVTADTDQLIYLRHIHGGAPAFLNPMGGGNLSLDDLCAQVVDSCGCGYGDLERDYFIEIKDFLGYQDLETILTKESQRIYGILTGDEGWRFVPESLAADRLKNSWGSREFIRFIAFGNSALFFNLHNSPAAKAYIKRQHEFGTKTYGGVNPYFLVDSKLAGVNHGIMYAQELVMVIKTIANRILHRKSNFTNRGYLRLGTEIRKTKLFRSDLINTLNRVENLGISELGELEHMLLESHRITPLIENIKYLLEMLESDLDLLYQQSTNRLVNVLTVAGLFLAVLGLIFGSAI